MKPRSYTRDYTILFLTNSGEIMGETKFSSDTRAEAKQFAVQYAQDYHILYDKISVRQSQYTWNTSVKEYLVKKEGVDPLDAERTNLTFTVSRRYIMMMQKLFSVGVTISHFSKLVKDEIRRLYDMYFDEEGNVRRDTGHR